jgi:glucose-6-phosphate 1-epimerase
MHPTNTNYELIPRNEQLRGYTKNRMDLQTLSDTFAIPGVLAFDETDAGLLRARISTPACTAELYLHGAHLTAWQPAGHGPVIFLSEKSLFAHDKAIRGGIPIIFPWFGPRSATPNNPRTDGPAHGFARTSEWDLAFAALSGNDLHLTLTLAPSEASRALGVDHFRLALQFILGETLTIRLTVANEAGTPLDFAEAFHTYLTVGDATQIKITGLANTDYIDKVDNNTRKRQTDPIITITAETDRPYLNTAAAVTVEDPTLLRRITVAKQNSQTTVVWNPWTDLSIKLADMADEGWREMVCIETANALENTITLPPNSTHTMESKISVESL